MQHLQKLQGEGCYGYPLQFGSESVSTVTSLRRVDASIPVFSLAGRAFPGLRGLLRCCAARRPAPAPPGGAAAPRCNSWLLPRSARWLLRTKSRRADAGRALPAPLPSRWPAKAGRTGWQSPVPQKFSLSPSHDTDGHFAGAWQVPAGSLAPPPACESIFVRRVSPRARSIPDG